MVPQRCVVVPLVVVMLLTLMWDSPFASAQIIDDCPRNWFEYGGSCYNFILYSEKTYQEASIFCLQDYASLISINSDGEHRFMQNWLSKYDSSRQEWFTSGFRDSQRNLFWESDGTVITLDYFPTPAMRDEMYVDPLTDIAYNQLIYKYYASSNQYMWAWGRVMKTSPFVCEISKSDTWKIYQQRRDFSYGTGITDPNLWETGPNITYQSTNTAFFQTRSGMTAVTLDCQASGNPRPDYQWFRRSPSQTQKEWVTSALGDRFTITNGRLTIDNPSPTDDTGFYSCVATNTWGTVMSNPIEVSYGYIGQFSNVPPSPITATMYMGKEISCQPPTHNTELHYNWFKQNVFNFLRPELNAQYFLSKNGNLYISEIQASDADTYYCAVFMAPKAGQVLASTQPPSRNSMGIEVKVQGENANTYGPDIQDKFPQYYPEVPMVGDKIEIECLAYGRLPLYYSWVREDAPMHPEASMGDHNRVLTIPKARLEDTGTYTCVVRGDRNTANKTVHMSLKARPSFPYPLQNQHLDAESKLVWVCNAIGVPRPRYTWYKNGEVLTSSSADGITVSRNILTITKVDADKHDGMYQCEAENSYGKARSSAQLRALSFPPTFKNSPVESSKQAAEGGNITISCRPQAAPRAIITWEKNGGQVGRVLPNGDLELSQLSLGDAGTYTCVATNDLGEDRSSCVLAVQSAAVFTELPSDQEVQQNETASLPCKASFDRSKTDIIYSWMFNEHIIDFLGLYTDDPAYYSMPYAQNLESGMLYIIGAQFKHEGQYTCRVTTVTGSISTTAYLRVNGPPGEPGGVHARQKSNQDFSYASVELWWQEGEFHGYPVTKYAIQYQSIYEDEWRVLVENIPNSDTVIEEYPDWRGYTITDGLSPGCAYKFRVKAGNSAIGYGPWSGGPYKYYTMASAAPIVAPSNVGGGGGSVGELTITWDPMPRSLWGGPNLRYIVYYRRNDTNEINGKWEESDELRTTVLHRVVGQELYYTPYEVKVRAVNAIGRGPNSTSVIVYSAEDMPTNIAPTFVQANAINGTAGIVEWVPIENTRESAKGTVFAYQVNYWDEGDTRCLGLYEKTAKFIRFYGQVNEGLVIGMEYGADYCLNLQFLNHAGLGPKTDNYYFGMNDAPPSLYPEYVTVMSNGPDSVRVMWRGISTLFGEDPLIGYKAWWWDVREDIRSANVAEFGRTTTGVIHGVEPDTIYKLRMLGFSTGGDGKKSRDVFFTLGGLVLIDPITTEIMNTAPSIKVISMWPLLLTILVARFL